MLEILNKYLCGIILPIVIIAAGIYFAFRLKLFYILHPFKLFKSMCKGGFKSLSLALAGTLGVGNIVGVASALIFSAVVISRYFMVVSICSCPRRN